MYIKRSIYPQIRSHLDKPEISLILGPRQAGKTTICKQLQAELEHEGRKTIYLNLDVESDFSLLETQDKLIFALKNRIGEEPTGYVFIDEYQRKENGGQFLKGLYDLGLPYKFIITGSGSVELKEDVHESLAGRKRVFEVTTLTFDEYIGYETNYEYELGIDALRQMYPDRLNLYLQNYLTFGGYPKVVTSSTIEEKRAEIEEIYNSYLIRDITALLKIEKTNAFQKLVENLGVLQGKLVNLSQLAGNIGLSTATLEKYLWYLEKTFIVSPVRPYSKNPLKEINKASTYYFNDLGMSNFISGDFEEPMNRSDLGFDFQNFVYLQLAQRARALAPATVGFWRTKDNAEVDFVLRRGDDLVGIEVKFADLKDTSLPRSVHSFISTYSPNKFYVINKSLETQIDVSGTQVCFIPFSKTGEVGF